MRIKNLHILAARAPLTDPQRRTLTRVAIALAISFGGVVTAFGIAPGTITETVPTRQVVENLALPQWPEAADEAQVYTAQETTQRGDTIPSLLTRLNVNDPKALDSLRRDRIGKLIFQVRPGKTLQAQVDGAGNLLRLRLFHKPGVVLTVERSEGGLVARERPATAVSRVVYKAGVVTGSFYAATDAADIPDAVANQLAQIFASEIDFRSDVRRGDTFSVGYEAFYEDGEPIRYGRVVAAEFVHEGRSLRAMHYGFGGSDSGYFTPEGRNLQQSFLRSPIEFSRVTSGFAGGREHPIMRDWRAHRGVDFAAPYGTRVLAAASGVVAFAGRMSGYGNVIEVQHSGKVSTLYAHLSGFAGDLRNGMEVRQGEVIGHVGATGWATGPHLHYEFKVAGVHQDPFGAAVPTATGVPAQNLAMFRQQAVELGSRLALVKTATASSFE